MRKEKGFTLIELLAVIIILGVIMLIAIPSVTRYINDSRKDTYVDTARQIVKGAIPLVNSGELDVYDTDTTYYIPAACVSTENALSSPFGEFQDAYVIVGYTGEGYVYYWASVDTAHQGIEIKEYNKLTRDDVKANIETIEPNIGIGSRAYIKVLDEDECVSFGDASDADNKINDNGQVVPVDDVGDGTNNVVDCDNNEITNTVPTNAKGIYKIMAEGAYLDNGKSPTVTSCSGINFGLGASNTNGEGLFEVAATKNDSYPIYYYRGSSGNKNNLLFANYCWKIVRTTNTGGIKLIYNGVPSGSSCNNTGTASQIGADKYSSFNNDNAYMGYKHGTPGASNYNDAHNNSTDSNMKTIVDAWYSAHLSGYSSYIEDSVFCNDRSIAPDSPGGGFGSNATNYNGRYRLNVNKKPSVNCANANDRYTVSSSIGNGKLTYPVALVTADEVSLAGGIWNQAGTYYLNTGTPWWTMTPSRMNNVYPSVFVVLADGSMYAHSGNIDGIRPSIVLNRNIEIAEGTEGTASNPYRLK